MMKLQIWGGAGEHGRSCYMIAGRKQRILLDCGVKKEGSGQYPLLDPGQIPLLTAVFLSHAHEDHSMALPLLYKHGYKGDVWTTRATAEQLPAYFASWRRYAERRGVRLPYGEDDIGAITFRYLEEASPPLQWFSLADAPRQAHGQEGAAAADEGELLVKWGRTGHLPGSVWLRLELAGKRVFFSGDYSRESLLLAADPVFDGAIDGVAGGMEWESLKGGGSPVTDLAIIDNAYGTDSEEQGAKLEQLRTAALDGLQAGGCVLLPVPAFGRGQDLLVWACEELHPYPLLVEPNIWGNLQRLAERQEAWLKPGAAWRIKRALGRGQGRIFVPADIGERERLLSEIGPCLILTADGMMESADARWYYERLAAQRVRSAQRTQPAPSTHWTQAAHQTQPVQPAQSTSAFHISRPSHPSAPVRTAPAVNTVILTGHASKDTFARNILERGTRESGCKVQRILYKVHQGLHDVRIMLNEVNAARTVLVHAPKAQTDRVCLQLEGEEDRLVGRQPEGCRPEEDGAQPGVHPQEELPREERHPDARREFGVRTSRRLLSLHPGAELYF